MFDAVTQAVLTTLAPYPGFAGGVRVAAADFDGDGRAEIVTAPGPGAAPVVHVYSGGTFALYGSLVAFPGGFAGGVFVAAPGSGGIRFTTADHAAFALGEANTFTIRTAGPAPTPTIAQAGALPSGVTFVDNGDGTATISGAPLTSGTFVVTLTASNGTGTDATQLLTITVQGAPAFTSPDAVTFVAGAPSAEFAITTTGGPAVTLTPPARCPQVSRSSIAATARAPWPAALRSAPEAPIPW